MAARFRAHGLGLILDVVPNHMGIGGDANRFWLSVLEWGEASPFAGWFDIDWNAPYPGLAGKVLVPFLGGQYGEVLAAGGLELRFDPAEGGFAVWAHDTHKLPICPRNYGTILRAGGLDDLAAAFDAAAPRAASDPRWSEIKAEVSRSPGRDIERALQAFRGSEGDLASWSALDALIAVQHWRAAKFNLDGDAIDYRRFFTISDLAGVRVELPEVFAATHGLVLGLLDEGLIDGLRIDHIDGLLDPKAYTLRLRRSAVRPFRLLVEKILAPDEELPEDWQTDGTTGYEVTNLLVGLAGRSRRLRGAHPHLCRLHRPDRAARRDRPCGQARDHGAARWPPRPRRWSPACSISPRAIPAGATSAAARCAPRWRRSWPPSTSTAPTSTTTGIRGRRPRPPRSGDRRGPAPRARARSRCLRLSSPRC